MPRTRSRRRDDYDDELDEPTERRGAGRGRSRRDEEDAADEAPARPGELSPNAHWLFGSLVAALVLAGFAFGVWAGASRSKPVEVAEAKPKEADKPAPAPAVQAPQPKEPERPKEPEPKAREPEPEPKKPAPEPMKPEPKPEPKAKEPEPKKPEPEPKKLAAKPVAFKEIQPILNGYCGNCHGLAGKPKGGVDLRTIASIKKGGNDGEIVVPGDPKKSRLYVSIMEGSMPPDGKPAPNPKELQLIHDWILSGAK
jgi:hypothetical protein